MPADAGSSRDANPALPTADIVPSVIDFGAVHVGGYLDRTMLAVNRNDEDTLVFVLSENDAYVVRPVELAIPANTRREMTVRFAPESAGVHDEEVQIDACGGGCITRIRLVGSSE